MRLPCCFLTRPQSVSLELSAAPSGIRPLLTPPCPDVFTQAAAEQHMTEGSHYQLKLVSLARWQFNDQNVPGDHLVRSPNGTK